MSRRSIAMVIVLNILILGVLAGWFTRTISVRVVSLSLAPLVRTLQFSAKVVTASRVDIGSTLTGRVQKVAVTEGALVKKGEILVRLESDELRAALEQAQAGERLAEARLSGLRSTGRSSVRAALAQADSVLAAAQAELQRTQALVNQGFISQARLDESLRAVAVAQAQQIGARAQLAANAESGTDITQAQAQLGLATSATSAAKARLEQAVLTAPTDAKVLTRNVEPGQIVQPGRALLSLALTGPLQLIAQVDERYLEQLQVGQTASILADAFPTQRFTAHVLSIAPLVDAQRGAIEVKFSIPGLPPTFLREDMTLSAEVETARSERALVVPVASLRGGDAPISTVLIEREGRAQERAVRLGIRTLEAAQVLEGLAEGDRVIVDGSLKPGSRIRGDATAMGSTPIVSGRAEDAGSAMTNAMGR